MELSAAEYSHYNKQQGSAVAEAANPLGQGEADLAQPAFLLVAYQCTCTNSPHPPPPPPVLRAGRYVLVSTLD